MCQPLMCQPQRQRPRGFPVSGVSATTPEHEDSTTDKHSRFRRLGRKIFSTGRGAEGKTTRGKDRTTKGTKPIFDRLIFRRRQPERLIPSKSS